MLVTSQSAINCFNKCKFLFQTLYVQGIESALKNRHLTLGTLIHAGIAEHLREGVITKSDFLDVIEKQYPPLSAEEFSLVEEYRQMALELVPEAEQITDRAIKFLGRGWETVTLDGEPLIERELEVELPNGMRFRFVVDWVARERSSGAIWLFDHKTRVNIQPDESEDYNMQMAIYQYLLRSFGIETVGSICFQIRSRLPSEPNLNKNGTMSRTEIASDWETYQQALVKNGLNPLDYADMQVKLQNKEFFRLSRSYRSADMLQRIWDKVVIPTLVDMKNFAAYHITTQNQHEAPRNIHSTNCKLCSIREYCHAKLHGYDTSWFFESGTIVYKEVEDE